MIIEKILLLGILISISYHLIVYLQTRYNFKKGIMHRNKLLKNIQSDSLPFVSILKPLKGLDDGLEENIKSFFELDYPRYEIIFGFHSEDDPALPIVEKIVREHPDSRAKIIIDSTEIGLNPKINNLNNIYPYATGELILISDSNTRTEKNFLKELVMEIFDDNVSLVSASIRGVNDKNIFALMENIHLSSFITGILQSASSVAGIQITVGKAILIKRKTLDQIGGFYTFRNYLAEDHLMGLEVEKHGYKIIPSTVVINTINENWHFKKLINRHRRWNLMRANIDLKFYILEFLTYTSTLAILLFLINPKLFTISIGTILIKTTIDYLISRVVNSDIKFYKFIVVPLKDILMTFLWFLPFIYNKISWRENRLKVLHNSLLMPVQVKN